MIQSERHVTSSLDGSDQISLFYPSESKEKRPLLVGLHTWSYDRYNQIKNMLPFAEANDFNLLLPEFRGKNLPTNPHCRLACGSEYAKQDIKDAIDDVIQNAGVDEENVFLLGLSGGGHMALLMAGFCPQVFKAIGAFVPITDLKAWTEQNKKYAPSVIACCGDDPEEMWRRSPMAYVDTIATANLKIFHGKFDPVVPVSQSLELYRVVMEKHPEARVFLDIFDGGHQIDMAQASYWLLSQYNKKIITEVTG